MLSAQRDIYNLDNKTVKIQEFLLPAIIHFTIYFILFIFW